MDLTLSLAAQISKKLSSCLGSVEVSPLTLNNPNSFQPPVILPLSRLSRISPYFILIGGASVLLLLRSPQQSFMAHDEGYYAQQARWIFETGDWITVPWWGEPVYDRTIGLQWLIAAAYTLFGVSEGVARLPSTLACLLSVVLTYEIGRRCINQPVAWLGAAILTATPIWIQAGRLATQDIPLVLIELLGIWALLMAEEHRGQRLYWGILAGSTVGLGFLIKGFMAILPVVALTPYLIGDSPRHRHLTNPGLYIGGLLGAIPTAIWLEKSMAAYGLLPLQQLFGKLFYLSETSYFGAGPFYYLWNIPANAFPWPLFALGGLALAIRDKSQRRQLLWIGYPLTLLLELSLFKTRTWYYPLQLLPFNALLAAFCLNHLTQLYVGKLKTRRWLPGLLSWGLGGLGSVLIVAGIVAAGFPELLSQSDIRLYGWLGLAGGLGWLVPGGVYLRDRTSRLPNSPHLWQFGWLLGPWLVVATLGVTGLWGNYNSEVKTALQQPNIAAVLDHHPINFVFEDKKTWGAKQDTVLLTFYTPQLGQTFPTLSELPSQAYAWVSPDDAHQLTPAFRSVGEVKNWRLVQVP